LLLLLSSFVVEEAMMFLSFDAVDLDVVSACAVVVEVLSREPPGVDRMGRVWEDGKAESDLEEACW
jgi:hypothetical protein